jgi:hypothetical protein
MKKNKITEHTAIHCMASILIRLIYDVLKENAPFDNEKYKSLLRRYKDKKPEKIQPSLERELPRK